METPKQNSAEKKKLEVGPIDISHLEETGDITFSFSDSEGNIAAYLQCEVDKEKNIFTARTMAVKSDYQRQGFGKQMFIAAIEYARVSGYKFVTDSGVSENAVNLIESLAAEGYNFTKNPDLVEREATYGKRFVSQDGSPAYVLVD